MMAPPILFAALVEGGEIGAWQDVIDRKMLGRWERLYPWQAGRGATPSMALMLSMRAYLAVVRPRPPGNVHVKSDLKLHAGLETCVPIRTVVSCLAKREVEGRRRVDFGTESSAEGQLLFAATIGMIWAR